MTAKTLTETRKRTPFRVGENPFEKLKEINPDAYKRFIAGNERPIEKHGVPSLGGSFGGLWDEDCPNYVNDLLSLSGRYGRPLRIIVEPEPFDEDSHHWKVTYDWLIWDQRRSWIPLRTGTTTRLTEGAVVAEAEKSQRISGELLHVSRSLLKKYAIPWRPCTCPKCLSPLSAKTISSLVCLRCHTEFTLGEVKGP